MDNGLQISNLCVYLGGFAIESLNLNVKRGCVTGLVGRNGAGKSTLIKTIMRQQDAGSGKILYNGLSFAENEEKVLTDIACVFDAPHFLISTKPAKLKVYLACAYPSFDAELFDGLMQKFNLPQNMRVSKYSFGMQRKLCLIIALSQRPNILLLDEPTSGVDPVDRNEIVSLIQDFMLDESHTVLFSTHITEDLDKIADYIVMMDHGKIILAEDKVSLTENYRLVITPELTPQLKRGALGIKKIAYGYSLITRDTIVAGNNVEVKIPTVEELFIHLTDGNLQGDSL